MINGKTIDEILDNVVIMHSSRWVSGLYANEIELTKQKLQEKGILKKECESALEKAEALAESAYEQSKINQLWECQNRYFQAVNYFRQAIAELENKIKELEK